MSAAFEEAFELIKRDAIPSDIISRLDELYLSIDFEEEEEFQYLYEGAYLVTNELSEEEYNATR